MKKFLTIFCVVLFTVILGFLSVTIAERIKSDANDTASTIKYDYKEYPLVRNNIKLHLDQLKLAGKDTKKNILLIHGVTYSSHEFDINYEDYSLA